MKRRLKPLLSTLLVLTMLLSLLPGGVMAASENAQMASAVMGTEGGANATPEGESAGTPDGEPAGTPDREPAGTPDGEPAGTPDGEPAGTPDGESAGTPDGDPAGTPEGDPAGTPDGEPAGTPEGEPAGTPDGEPAGTPGAVPGAVPNLVPNANLATALAAVSSIRQGDVVMIYYPTEKMVMGVESKPYNSKDQLAAVAAADDGSVPAGAAQFRVYLDEENNYVFQSEADGTFLYLDGTHVRLTAERGEYTSYQLEDSGTGGFFIKSVNAQFAGKAQYLEYYGDSFTCYGMNNDKTEIYTFQFYKTHTFELAQYPLPKLPEPPQVTLPIQAGDTVVLYNVGAQGVLAGQDDNTTSPSVNNAAAAVADGKATPANGGRVFTVEESGDGYFRFKTAHDGYLCSNGTGSNAYYDQNASTAADWTVTAYNGGYNLMSREAKYKNNPQYLEYYGGSYKTYSLYSDSDADIYTFQFYPLTDGITASDGVINLPAVTFGTLPNGYVGQDYSFTFTVEAIFGVSGLSVSCGGLTLQPANEGGTYSVTIPAAAMTAGKLTVAVTGTDTKGVGFSGSAELTVLDQPVITEVFPAPSTQTGEDMRPEIGFLFANGGENPTVTMTVNGTSVTPTVENGRVSYRSAEDLPQGKTTVTVILTRADSVNVSRAWVFTVGTAQYQLYFGQLHSHTGEFSDGAGTLADGLSYVAGLPESENVDFVAFTDHSNYFDTQNDPNPEAALYDVSQMSAESKAKWDTYTSTINAFNAQHAGQIVALAGFEMTWSGGPGHINTFNTPGIVSRNNAALNEKDNDAGLQAYYQLLSNENLTNSISQLNHPGDTFGNFADFGYYDPIIDSRVYLVEVGNGEGAIGEGGYYPSYEQYIMALDKGWHVAPTNNQDNHKGKWGNANDARDVVLTNDFSVEGIYEAIRNYRVYATEDKNLEISYTLNGQMMGSIIEVVPETASINVSVYDPDATDSIARVEVVANSGVVAYTWDNAAELAAGQLSCAIPAQYSYYFIRVIQDDSDIAVTAPVWVGETVKLGVSSVACGTDIPVTNEALTLTTTLFNGEEEGVSVKSVTYASGGQDLYTDTTGYTLSPYGTQDVTWSYTPTQARVMTITVTAVLVRAGVEYTYAKDITLDVLDAGKLMYIGIDASHYNEYVNGNYNKSMGNFSALAAGYSVRTVQLNTSQELLEACANTNGKYKAIVLTAPSRRDGDALRNPYQCYTPEEIQAIASFNAAGGAVILAGWGDYYESYQDFPAGEHMAAQQNLILEALGSSLRISDDELKDDQHNGGQPQRLYLSGYNLDSFLLNGVEYDPEYPYSNMHTELYSQYGGASIYVVDGTGAPTTTIPGTVTPVVYGFDSSYSADDDKDNYGGLGAIPKYTYSDGTDRHLVLATEQLAGRGLIVVAGAAFLSNFEVQAQVDNAAEKNYSNYKICENLVNYLNPAEVTPIAQVQAQPQEQIKYTIEGVVTSNASGYDKETAFFDCIYVQDSTGGINAFPVAGNYKVGDIVRITGTTSSYQGERQLAVTSIKKVGETTAPEPKAITTREAAQSSYLGSLVKVQGVVVSIAEAEGLVQTIIVRDNTGYDARLFIDGYITKDKVIENLAVGHEITAVGLASYDNTFNGAFPRIRIRDRSDIICGTEVVSIPPAYVPNQGGTGSSGNTGSTGESTGGSDVRDDNDDGSTSSKTETVTNSDGSVTTTVSKTDGSSTATTKYPNGSMVVVTTGNDGTTKTVVQIPQSEVDSVGEGASLSLPLTKRRPAASSASASVITVELAGDKSMKVEFPVTAPTPGTVVILVNPDGSEKVLVDSAISDNGITATLSNGDTVKIVDNAKSFADVPDSHWGSDAIDYVSSRGLLEGTGENTFSPDVSMTRAMGWTLLARFDGVDTSTGTTWYERGLQWAVDQEITDGTNMDGALTREQLITMLWRYAGSPAAQGALAAYTDADSISDWALESMTWAVDLGLVKGNGESQLNPQGIATRAEVAALFARFAAWNNR